MQIRITPTNRVLKLNNASTLRALGKCKVQLTNSKDKMKYNVNFTIVEDEHCANLNGSKTAQQMQLITVIKIKPCHGPAERVSTANVDVNLTSSQQLKGFTLEHTCKLPVRRCFWWPWQSGNFIATWSWRIGEACPTTVKKSARSFTKPRLKSILMIWKQEVLSRTSRGRLNG